MAFVEIKVPKLQNGFFSTVRREAITADFSFRERMNLPSIAADFYRKTFLHKLIEHI